MTCLLGSSTRRSNDCGENKFKSATLYDIGPTGYSTSGIRKSLNIITVNYFNYNLLENFVPIYFYTSSDAIVNYQTCTCIYSHK